MNPAGRVLRLTEQIPTGHRSKKEVYMKMFGTPDSFEICHILFWVNKDIDAIEKLGGEGQEENIAGLRHLFSCECLAERMPTVSPTVKVFLQMMDRHAFGTKEAEVTQETLQDLEALIEATEALKQGESEAVAQVLSEIQEQAQEALLLCRTSGYAPVRLKMEIIFGKLGLVYKHIKNKEQLGKMLGIAQKVFAATAKVAGWLDDVQSIMKQIGL